MRNLAGWNGQGAPPAGAAINDPDLKKMTATVMGGAPLGQIKVEVIYADPSIGAEIRLWTDQTKTTEIGSGGFLPNYPTSDFYVEGRQPSASESDVMIQVTYETATIGVMDNTDVTVVPFAVNMEVRTSDPATVTLMKNAQGKVVGLNSGQQSGNGTDPNSGRPGAIFVSYVWVTGAAGNPGFIQTVTGVDGNQPGVSLTNNYDYIHYLKDQATYPILDYVENAGVPFPAYGPITNIDLTIPNQKGYESQDTPYMAWKTDPDAWADLISSMDLTFLARLYTAWKFPDGTLYTLATVDWQVVFQASLVNGVLTPDPTSVVSAEEFEQTHGDPPTVVLPIYNEQFDFTLWG